MAGASSDGDSIVWSSLPCVTHFGGTLASVVGPKSFQHRPHTSSLPQFHQACVLSTAFLLCPEYCTGSESNTLLCFIEKMTDFA
jgi:hypothetical protein